MGKARAIDQLHEGMRSRQRIGVAVGLLMHRYGMSEERAFAFLVRASSHGNVKLRDVAAEVVREFQGGLRRGARSRRSSSPRVWRPGSRARMMARDGGRRHPRRTVHFLPDTQEALDEYLCLTEAGARRSLLTWGSPRHGSSPSASGLSLTLYGRGPDLHPGGLQPPAGRARRDAVSTADPAAAVHDDAHRVEAVDEPLDEDRWALFAQASAAVGVASSLSLPVVEHGRVVGDIHLYASSADAFRGHHQTWRSALGASAAGAVTNADLAFDSRRRAERAPQQLRDQQAIEVGVGILAAREDLDVEAARGPDWSRRLRARASAWCRRPWSSSTSTAPDARVTRRASSTRRMEPAAPGYSTS